MVQVSVAGAAKPGKSAATASISAAPIGRLKCATRQELTMWAAAWRLMARAYGAPNNKPNNKTMLPCKTRWREAVFKVGVLSGSWFGLPLVGAHTVSRQMRSFVSPVGWGPISLRLKDAAACAVTRPLALICRIFTSPKVIQLIECLLPPTISTELNHETGLHHHLRS